jgi:chromosome segregation ATPase
MRMSMIALAIALLLGLAGGSWAGYSFGGRRVADLEGQIQAIKDTGEKEKRELAGARDRLEADAKAVDAKHQSDMDAIKKDYGDRQAQLEAQNRQAGAQIAKLTTQVGDATRRRDQLLAQMKSASPGDTQALQAQVDALNRQIQAAGTRTASLRCLDLPVPDDQVRLLGGVSL